MEKILLFSGGLDSYIAWHYLDHPNTVYFDTDIQYSSQEVEVIQNLIPDTIIDKSLSLYSREIKESSTAFIPMRNLYLAMLACKYGDEIIIAGLKDDKVNDKNEEIFKEFSNILSKLNNRKITVTSPFWNMTKADVVGWYLSKNLPTKSLMKTISCYTPNRVILSEHGEHYCGSCPCCFRKWVSFYVNGIKIPFYNFKLIEEYYQKALRSEYDAQRNSNIIQAYEGYHEVLKNKPIIAVDIDGVLTNETKGHDYKTRTANELNIAKINELFNLGFYIHLWTSRYPEDQEVTLNWLSDHSVCFNKLTLGKLQYTKLIDDKSIDLNSF